MKVSNPTASDAIKRPLDRNAEFLGQALFPSIRALPSFVSTRLMDILKDLGIDDPQDDAWYSVRISTEFYRRLLAEYGPNTVYDMGKAINEYAVFPPNIKTLYDALSTMHITYDLNHRNGYMGFYEMVSHDEENNTIIMHSHTPYPCDMNRGLFIGLGRRYASTVRVQIDEAKSSKLGDINDTWYIIKYS